MGEIMKVVSQVYETNDYAKFKKLESNRAVLKGRLNKLIASFSEKSIINPIVINKNWEIIDGQGRYEARKALKLPIQFVIDEDADIDDCRRMNKYNTNWNLLDFAESYAESGNMSYIYLLKACKITKMPISRVMRLANHSRSHKDGKSSVIEDGTLKFQESDVEKVCILKQKADEIADALTFTKGKNNAFYTAVKVACETEGYRHDRMLSNCKKCRSNYAQMSGVEDQLKEFSRIYNFGRSSSKLYFEDYMRTRGRNARNYRYDSYYNEENVSTLKK